MRIVPSGAMVAVAWTPDLNTPVGSGADGPTRFDGLRVGDAGWASTQTATAAEATTANAACTRRRQSLGRVDDDFGMFGRAEVSGTGMRLFHGAENGVDPSFGRPSAVSCHETLLMCRANLR
jgi:hypothetical protein